MRWYQKMSELVLMFTNLNLIDFDDSAATILDDLRSQKLGVKPMDLRIAAVALANGLTLVTRNRSDFDKVPGLTTEDWTK